jgi:hypothetical protein
MTDALLPGQLQDPIVVFDSLPMLWQFIRGKKISRMFHHEGTWHSLKGLLKGVV